MPGSGAQNIRNLVKEIKGKGRAALDCLWPADACMNTRVGDSCM
jgi:hypothetical protein